MLYYSAFGLSIRSTLEFVELSEIEETADIDLEIVSGKVEINPPTATRHNFEIQGLGRFLIEDGKRIIYEYLASNDESDLRLFILAS